MHSLDFTVGEIFPLPIKEQADGAMFQVDANGTMFLLQLSRVDLIATEAFRTGKMEFALYEEGGILFLLYQIDGIFKTGWGDAPLALHLLEKNQLPTAKSLADKNFYLYFVDTHLKTLLAQRTIEMNKHFTQTIKNYLERAKKAPLEHQTYQAALAAIWNKKSPAAMRADAIAVQEIPLALLPNYRH